MALNEMALLKHAFNMAIREWNWASFKNLLLEIKLRTPAPKVIYDMGFEPSFDYIRTRYGEGWSKKVPPNPGTLGAAARFSEQQLLSNQLTLDTAISKIGRVTLGDAAVLMIQPVLDAIDGTADLEDALHGWKQHFRSWKPTSCRGCWRRRCLGRIQSGACRPQAMDERYSASISVSNLSLRPVGMKALLRPG